MDGDGRRRSDGARRPAGEGGAVLFDFFGTLVDFEPDLTRLGAPATHRHAQAFGFVGDHREFIGALDAAWRGLADASRRTLREFSAAEATEAFAAATRLPLDARQVAELTEVFREEWTAHLRPAPGAADLIRHLAPTWSIGVVSNTHSATIVPTLLAEMEVADVVDVVVLSIDHGWIKPHPSIYEVALHALDADPGRTWFVGDSFDADYEGPRQLGMRSLLIDPERRHEVPEHHRISAIADLETAMQL